jgi:hypothetical protein
MQLCPQTETQSVYQHGCSVKEHIFDLISYLKTGKIDEGWRLPIWMETYREQLLSALLPEDVIEEYTIFHDCSKPYCLFLDEEGKRHFPDHANKSYNKWLEVGGNEEAAQLMKMDMDIHLLKDKDVDEFCKRPQAITLLLAGLSEVHSNAKMFGGIESESFKIKWSQINKRGQKICQKLFGDS